MNQQGEPIQAKEKLKNAIFDIGPVNARAHEYHKNLKFMLSRV